MISSLSAVSIVRTTVARVVVGALGTLSLVASVATGCSSTTTTTVTEISPSLITVTPSAFLGDEPCARKVFARYVTTLVDVTVPSGALTQGGAPDACPTPFTLASSGATACTQSIAFAYVYAGDEYVARVDGYVRDDIVPYGSGSPVMVDPASGAPVPPDFSTTCGELPPALALGSCVDLDAALGAPQRPTRAVASTNVFLHDCGALVPIGAVPVDAGGGNPDDAGPAGDATAAAGAIRIDIASVLAAASQSCQPNGVQTYLVDVTPPSTTRSDAGISARPTACTDDLVISPVDPDPTPYDIAITAKRQNGACVFTTACSARVVAGETVQPTCGAPQTCAKADAAL